MIVFYCLCITTPNTSYPYTLVSNDLLPCGLMVITLTLVGPCSNIVPFKGGIPENYVKYTIRLTYL